MNKLKLKKKDDFVLLRIWQKGETRRCNQRRNHSEVEFEFLELKLTILSARTPVASPREEDELSLDEIILVESDKKEASEELVALPKSKAIVEQVARGLSKLSCF